MPRRKCATVGTHVPGARRVAHMRTGVRPPVWACTGSLVEVEFSQGNVRQGIVLESTGGGAWLPPWLTILFNDGKREVIRSPDVRIINRRRQRRRK